MYQIHDMELNVKTGVNMNPRRSKKTIANGRKVRGSNG